MSTYLGERNIARSRKAHRCTLCFERIEVGQPYIRRAGADGGDFCVMRMHPECHAFEPHSGLQPEDYEDMSDPSFTRQEARDHAAKLEASK